MKAPLHIAVFCRALIPGQVKTRLIPAYGVDGSAHIYRQLVERTLHTVMASGAAASLWVAGDTHHASVADWSARFALPVCAQCDGDLGARMAQSLMTLAQSHERVLLVGTDCPVLDVDTLRAAAAALSATCQWVFTPAEDGGYVLVGSNAPSGDPFADVVWSTARVMAQTRDALRRSGLQWAETQTLWDVDAAADVARAERMSLLSVSAAR